MKEVSVGKSKSWEKVHAAAWTFEKMRGKRQSDERLVALCSRNEFNDEVKKQMKLLEQMSEVIDLHDEETAASNLAKLLHLS